MISYKMTIEFSDLEKKLEQCKVHWYKSRKKRSLKLIEHLEKQIVRPYTGGLQFLDFLGSEFYENLSYFLEEVADEISAYLQFSADDTGRIKKIEDKILKLSDSYQQNRFSGVLTPENFFNDLINPYFPYSTYILIYTEVEEKIKDATEKEDLDYDYIYFPATEEILSLTKILMELKLLQAIHLKIKSEGEKNLIKEIIVPNVVVNKYPEIFTSINAYLLFNYTLTERKSKEKIGPALVTKLLAYFKDEDRIFEEVKPSDYKNFLKKEHQYTLKKFDDRTAPNNREIKNYANIEEIFKQQYDLIN